MDINKVNYKGFEIQVNKGDNLLYYSVVKLNDGWIFINSVDIADKTIEEKISYLIKEIDSYLSDPENYKNEEIYRY